MKKCTRCKKEKALFDFPKSGGNGKLSSWCRPCHSNDAVARRKRKQASVLGQGGVRASLLAQVKAKLTDSKITQTALANAVGVYPSLVTLWFKGKVAPHTKNLKTACEFLDIEFPLDLRANNEGRLPLEVIPCKVCGEMFPVYKTGVKSCSKSCSGILTSVRQLGENNPSWSGGTYPTGGGYVMDRMDDGTRILQHRKVMESLLGRPLEVYERVHHKNGDRADNSPQNLELWIVNGRNKKDPAGQRLSDMMAHFLAQPEFAGMEDQAEAAFRRVFRLPREA
jgi:transcriptional regulator with XRE-family HTH domain